MRDLKKGFTLIELIVVIAIISILTLIITVIVNGFVDDAEEAKDLANARTCYLEALIMWETYGTDTYDENAELDIDCIINGNIDAENFDGSIMPENATYKGTVYYGS